MHEQFVDALEALQRLSTVSALCRFELKEFEMSDQRTAADEPIPGNRFGYPDSVWETAREEMRRALIERARTRGTIGYAELISRVQAIPLERHSAPITAMLQEVAAMEDAAGRGILAALVIHKYRDKLPGPEFYALAEQLGRDTSDRRRCWGDEVERVYAAWSPD
jgi:hypothetical protein